MTAADAHALADPLAQAYAKAWAEVESWERKLRSDPRRESQRRRLDAARRGIESDMADLDDAAIEWLSKQLPRVYLGGGTDALTGGRGFAWNQVHQAAAQRLANGLHVDLLQATSNVRQSTKELVRQVAGDQQLKLALTGQQTAVSAGREMARILKTSGVTALVYKDGSRHGLAEYAQMAIRTTSAQAYNLGSLNAHLDVTMWEVFDGPNCGWTRHDDPLHANGLIVHRSVAEAHPISHPNCRRSFGPRPDLEPVKSVKAAPSDSERYAVGRDDRVVKATDWDRQELAAAHGRVESWKRKVDDREQKIVQYEQQIADRKTELREVYGVKGSAAAAAMRRETNMRFAREQIDYYRKDRDLLRAELADYERAAQSAASKVVDSLPAYNPNNPLEFYGNRVTIYDDDPRTLAKVREFETLPPKLHEALRDYYAQSESGGAYFGNRSIVEMDGLGRLRGQATRESGHGGSRTRRFDEVAGAHSPNDRVTAIGKGSTGSHSLTLHETSHALDHALGGVQDLSDKASFVELLDAVKITGARGLNPYFTALNNPTGWRSELFAEAFSIWLDAHSQGFSATARAITKELGLGPGHLHIGQGLADWFDRLVGGL